MTSIRGSDKTWGKINRRLHSLQLTKKGAAELQRYRVLVAKLASEIVAALTAGQASNCLR
jgi:hypothetical protein